MKLRLAVGYILATAIISAPLVHAAPAERLDLRTWRVTAENASIVAENEFADRGPVYRVAWPTIEKGKPARLALAKSLLRQMMDCWMPPYVGALAKRIAFSIYKLEGSGKFIFRYDVGEKKPVEKRFQTCYMKPNCWNDYAYDVVLKPGCALGGVSFEIYGGANEYIEFLLADPRVELDDGRVYDLLNPDPPRYTTMMKAPARTKAAKRAPTRPVLKFGCGTAFPISSKEILADYSKYMKKYLPEYDIMWQLAWAPGISFADILEELPENIYAQFAFGQHDLHYARLCEALVKNRFGHQQNVMFNSTVATHPLMRGTYEDFVRYLGTIGFNSVQQYDYVWYYRKGSWGYDAASVAAFREDLTGTDEGLLLGATKDEPERRIGFWDYYRDYFGPKVPKATDYGFADWQEYRPNTDTPASSSLMRALITYEWLRQAQRYGEWCNRYCHGGNFDFLLNGEGHFNGNDHVYLPRLKHTGRVHPEFFNGTPPSVEFIYRASGRFIRNAHRYGKEWGITVETSRGAGGSQPYWSEKTGYVMSYMLSAVGYDTFEYDCAPVQRFWPDNTNRNNGAWYSLSLGMADARGFRQAKLDGARKPISENVYLITERSIASDNPSLTHPPADNPIKDDFRGALADEQVDFEITDPLEWPLLASGAKMVFISPLIKRMDLREAVTEWARQPGHTLVTNHEDIASAVKTLRRVQAERADRDAYVMPFETKCGQVAVVINRSEANRGYAGWSHWCDNVWSKNKFRQKYAYDDLLYKDIVTNAAVTVHVPVAKDGEYVVYRFLGDTMHQVKAVDGYLQLELFDAFCEIFYYSEPTKEFEKFLRDVRNDRKLTSEFFTRKE